MLKLISFLILSVSLFIAGEAQNGSTISLKTAIETAVANNFDVKQTGLQVQLERLNRNQARADMLPDINANIFHSRRNGRSIDPFTNSYINEGYNSANYSLSTSVVLFNGLLLQNLVKQNAYAYEASRLELQQTRETITLNTILAYLQVLNIEDLLALSQNQLLVSKKQVERLEVLNKEGAIAPALYYDLKGELAGNELTVVNTQNNLEAARLRLTQILNVPYDRNLKLERIDATTLDLVYSAGIEEVFRAAMEQLSLIKAAALRTQSAQAGVKAARGNLFPTLFFEAGGFTNYSSSQPITYGKQFSNNYSTSFSLGLRVPILNSFVARNNVTLAKINLQNFQQIEENTRLRLRDAVEESHFNMSAAFNRYQALLRQVEAFAESFRAAEVRFNAGVGTSVDYILAKNRLDQANINLISARYDYILRTKILDYYQGKSLF